MSSTLSLSLLFLSSSEEFKFNGSTADQFGEMSALEKQISADHSQLCHLFSRQFFDMLTLDRQVIADVFNA